MRCFVLGVTIHEFDRYGIHQQEVEDTDFVRSLLVGYVWGTMKRNYEMEKKNPDAIKKIAVKNRALKNRQNISSDWTVFQSLASKLILLFCSLHPAV
jgi:hypothetical protein